MENKSTEMLKIEEEIQKRKDEIRVLTERRDRLADYWPDSARAMELRQANKQEIENEICRLTKEIPALKVELELETVRYLSREEEKGGEVIPIRKSIA